MGIYSYVIRKIGVYQKKKHDPLELYEKEQIFKLFLVSNNTLFFWATEYLFLVVISTISLKIFLFSISQVFH